MARPLSICLIAGTRPNLIKVAPLMDAFRRRPGSFTPDLIHTGQHYDDSLSAVFFDELGIPRPSRNLDVGSGSHARQTAEIMLRFEPLLGERSPDALVVVGDVNSTLACSLVAVKLGIRVVHVEAGLRSFDRSMPEEINRILTDAISDELFASEPSGVENLRGEGIPPEKVHLVGNVMIDTLLRHREQAEQSSVLADQGLCPQGYGVLTLHRPSNVDDGETLARLLGVVGELAQQLPIVAPVHPRTLQRISALNLEKTARARPGLRLIPPLGYLDFLKLQAHARLVLTDSGGIQEETTILGVPCLTLRENTERPITITAGTNRLVGTDPDRIVEAARRVLSEAPTPRPAPELWDGRAAERIAEILMSRLAS